MITKSKKTRDGRLKKGVDSFGSRKKRRILLIDSESVTRQGIKGVLENEIRSLEFGDATESAGAIQLLREGNWDMVIMDIALPGRGGLDILSDIQANHPNLPVLVFTSQPEGSFGTRVLKGGAAGFLNKDEPVDALVTATRRILAGHKYITQDLAADLATRLDEEHPEAPHENLSDREFETLCLLAAGNSVTQIAERLSLSPKTISTYRSRLLEKMRMENNAELMAYGIRRGLAMDDQEL